MLCIVRQEKLSKVVGNHLYLYMTSILTKEERNASGNPFDPETQKR
jgi:hypothetical protein